MPPILNRRNHGGGHKQWRGKGRRAPSSPPPDPVPKGRSRRRKKEFVANPPLCIIVDPPGPRVMQKQGSTTANIKGKGKREASRPRAGGSPPHPTMGGNPN